jgi:hypothetical protein
MGLSNVTPERSIVQSVTERWLFSSSLMTLKCKALRERAENRLRDAEMSGCMNSFVSQNKWRHFSSIQNWMSRIATRCIQKSLLSSYRPNCRASDSTNKTPWNDSRQKTTTLTSMWRITGWYDAETEIEHPRMGVIMGRDSVVNLFLKTSAFMRLG